LFSNAKTNIAAGTRNKRIPHTISLLPKRD
jgi:hypothetical protein